MKKYFLLLILMLCSDIVYCQPGMDTIPQLPNSIINLEIGHGLNYITNIGLKSVIGYKNSGLLLGISPGGFEIGGQISYHSLYLNLGYGTYGVVNYVTTGKKDLLDGWMLVTGAMFDLNKSKRVFIDLGVGFYFGTYNNKFSGKQDAEGGIDWLNIGIGFRLGKIKDKGPHIGGDIP